MTGGIMESLGMGNWDIGIILIVFAALILILTVICIILLADHFKLKKRYENFCQGRDGKSLEKEIGELFRENALLRGQSDKNKNDIRIIYKTMEKTFQKVGLVKYDAFSQMGGKLSFSLCLLNEKNDGFIINSIHGTDGCYTYTKEIKKGNCELTLGTEEQKALSMAMEL